MDVSLMEEAEKYARKAEELPAFVGTSLLNIKKSVAELLRHIGQLEIFDQYTRHDISHVNEMLNILRWLIPQSTKDIMSPADWLMLVLAIYFHDLGMLVTKKEYKSRNSSGFPEFRDKILYSGSDGEDYRAKVMERYPEPDDLERFLYQEFVRHKHAERIKWWITGKAPDMLGVTHDAMHEVDKILEPLQLPFRRDLALICESHHLDDLYDFKKYKVSQPYGNSDQETANLQYIAAVLRTADLLHITSDRAPSITFRIINPTDPMSQVEWAKQRAVTRVKSQFGRDREGNPDENAPRNTIEVYANFTNENGFFGLTSYLSYALEQIRKTHEWVKSVNKSQGTRHDFPWRYIDDSNIETNGFIRETFEFTIDQAKILDLLTGHTLYNDTDVVIRELVQNSLDAIRLQYLVEPKSKLGKIRIHWDSNKRVLSVEDNGTGMTQDIIERHLLKVGSSRYQDSEFKKQYPNFSSISRFGIGVLSTFMIADTVEVTTCHPDEDKIRQISLRSVHGKYLIRLLDKQADEVPREIVPHGTLVKLTVRPSAVIRDIVQAAQKWIVVPNFDVFITVNEDKPIQVGFSSPKEAVIDCVQKMGLSIDYNGPRNLDTERG
jgi:Histidine kinase-, DNA gyrase B-, and HSP90-like ATPase